VTENRISINRENSGQYTIGDKDFRIQSDSVKVRLEDEELSEFTFANESQSSYTLGDSKGTVFSDASETAGLRITREIFVSDDGKRAAMRFAAKNQRDNRVHLDGIDTLQVNDEASMLVGGGVMREWKMLRYPFHKNDVPSYFRPTTVDKDFEDAVFSCINAVPGQGVLYNRMNVETRTISSGPILIIRNTERSGTPLLMLCTTGIEKHFMEMFLTTTQDRRNLESFRIECNFDGIAMDLGEEVDTHWLLMTTGEHESDLLKVYTDTVAAMYELPPVKRPPLTVYCSWYFYTWNLTQEYLLQELATIKEHNIPLDVVQIDDGWMDNYGSFTHDAKKFPKGMAYAAQKITEAGMMPGIWNRGGFARSERISGHPPDRSRRESDHLRYVH